MFYSIIVFIFVIIFLIKTNHESLPSRRIAALLVSYMLALLFLALYLSKDSYYYNTMNHYFSLPKFIWKALLLLPARKTFIIRLLNLSVLSVIYCSVLFSLSFLHPQLTKITPAVKKTVAVLLIAEQIAYDPWIIKHSYYFLYPRHCTVQQFEQIQKYFHLLTISLNSALLLISALFLFFTIVKTAGLRIIRLNILWITTSWLFIMLSFAYIFSRYPCYLVRFSRLSGVLTYLTAPLASNSILYMLFPYFIIFTLILITVSVYNSNMVNLRLKQKDFSISKEIAASDVTSRTFCHYMKNELLAISAELDNLELNEESQRAVQNVMDRCEHLYKRLDVIHRSTHAAVLILHREDLKTVMAELIREHLSQWEGVKITCQFSPSCPPVLIDRNYFEQAILNILVNAVESMETLPPSRRALFVSLDYIDQWAVFTIRDTGVGIAEENLPNIFTPFYTSAPVARHWGIGLSLTHKIVTAHEGLIDVTSTVGEGTSFQILLPTVQ